MPIETLHNACQLEIYRMQLATFSHFEDPGDLGTVNMWNNNFIGNLVSMC